MWGNATPPLGEYVSRKSKFQVKGPVHRLFYAMRTSTYLADNTVGTVLNSKSETKKLFDYLINNNVLTVNTVAVCGTVDSAIW